MALEVQKPYLCPESGGKKGAAKSMTGLTRERGVGVGPTNAGLAGLVGFNDDALRRC